MIEIKDNEKQISELNNKLIQNQKEMACIKEANQKQIALNEQEIKANKDEIAKLRKLVEELKEQIQKRNNNNNDNNMEKI